MLPRRQHFDRARILEAAGRARARRKRRKAIQLYRWALAVDPRSAEIHGRLGPLLAETGQSFEAWQSFRSSAQVALRAGQPERALAIYREAALYLPHEYQVWQAIAHLERKGGRDGEAIEVLLEGSRQLRARSLRPQAIHLLRRAREIDAWHFEAVLELALLLAVGDQREEARILLHGLAASAEGHQLRRIRAAQLRIDPGSGAFLRWLRALRGKEEPERASRADVVRLRRAG